MNRLTIACIAVSAALLVPSTAQAVTKSYAGPIKPSGDISMKLKRSQSGKKSIRDLAWSQVPVTCKGGRADSSSGNLSFKVPVRRHKFRAVGVLGNPNNPDAKVVIKGKIKTARKIRGTIALEGKKLPVDSGGTDDCQSGKLRWKATR